MFNLFEFSAWEAEIALDVVPLMVAFMVPLTVKSPVIVAEPDTTREPVTIGSKIFMYLKYYFNINTLMI